MSIRPLFDKTEVAEAYATFASRVSEGGQHFHRRVGFPGGNEAVELIWHANKNLWVVLEPDWEPSRYWCAYGIEDPQPASMLSITCEINPPRAGINRRCAGLFVRSQDGSTHLAHSGKVGGGRPGIGKASFLKSRGNSDMVTVKFPNRDEHEYIVIGCIEEETFLSGLAGFVHSVAAFKAEATSGGG